MDENVERAPDGPRPEPNAPRDAQPQQPAHLPETEAPAANELDTEHREINAEQCETLAAVYAAQLDERERLQDNREDLRNKQHDKRDRAADERDQAADERDRTADERDRTADARDRQANLREAQADERELTTLERHMQADIREAAADQPELESPWTPRSYTTDSETRPEASET